MMNYSHHTTTDGSNRLLGRFFLAMLFGVLAGGILFIALGLEAKWVIFAFIGLLIPFIAVLSGDIRRFFLGLMIFSIPLNADIHFFYNPQAAGMRGMVIGLPDICLFVLMIMWALKIATGSWPYRFRFYARLSVPFLLLTLISAVSALWASEPTLSLFDVWQMLKVYLMFLYLANTVNDEDDVSFILSMLAVGMALQGMFVLLQTTTGTSIALFGQETRAEVFRTVADPTAIRRPGGTVGHANTLGRYFVLLLPVGATLALRGGGKKTLFILTTAIGFLGMVFTLSRSAWIGLAFAMCVVVAIFLKRRLFLIGKLRNVAVLLLAGGMIVATLGPTIYKRLVSPDFGATMSRLTTAKVALKVIKDQPVKGVGMNNYKEVLDDYFDPRDPFTRVAPVHNLYLLFAAEIGLIGLAVFLWLLGALVRELIRAMRTKNEFLLRVIIGLFAGFLALLMMALSDYVYKQSPPLMTTVWVIGALAFVATKLIDRERVEQLRAEREILPSGPQRISGQLLRLSAADLSCT